MNFTSEKTPEYPLRAPASPLRAPPSPLRAPPSPLRAPPSPSRFSISPQMNRLRSVRVNMNEVNRATKNFSSTLKIGEGGFATVYKAQLQDGQVVAIKRAKMVKVFCNVLIMFCVVYAGWIFLVRLVI